MEGEAPVLIRTGSDGCLNESAGTSILQVSVRRAWNGLSHPHTVTPPSPTQHSLQGIEVGPQLGLVKSSSLESLHNVMHHTIKRDLVDDGGDIRSR